VAIDSLNTSEITASNITASNLKVKDGISLFKQLEIINETNLTPIKVTQNANNNLIELYNGSNLSFIIDNNSNVGIGTSSPDVLLHLNKIINDDVSIKLSDGNNKSGVILNKNKNQDFYISNTYQYGNLILGVNGKQETLTITPQGNIGIGTTSPLSVFDIRGGNFIIPENNRKIGVGTTNPLYEIDVKGVINATEICKSGVNISNIVTYIYDDRNEAAIATLSGIVNTTSNNMVTFVNSNKTILDTTVTANYSILTDFINVTNTNISTINSGFSTFIDSNIYLKNNMYWLTSDTNKTYYTRNTNIGIGISNPNFTVDINGNINSTEIYKQSVNISNIFVTSNHYETTSNNSFNYAINYNNLTNVPFIRNNNSNICLPVNCNIGIGITNPTSIFQINTGGKFKINNDNTDFTIIGTQNAISSINNTSIVLSGINRQGFNGSIEYITSNANHNWFVNYGVSKTQKMSLDNNGNLSINVISPNIYGKLQVNGVVNFHNGNNEAVPNNYMKSGSLTIGGTNFNYGGNTDGWTQNNTAGLLLECADNTEIAVNSSTTNQQVNSLIYYTKNYIEFGRNMGWGLINSHKFKANNSFEVYLNNCDDVNYKTFKLEPTSLWGDGCVTASETDGIKQMTMRTIVLQDAHICPATVGGTASMKWGRAGGVSTGTWWETGTLASGNFYIGNEASINNAIHINPSGSLGIGITNPQFKLEVINGSSITGNISTKYFNGTTTNITSSSTSLDSICAKFNSSIWCTNSIISSSDERIKKEIVNIDSSKALDTIRNIQPIKYKYINNIENENKDVYGFIAQDVKKLIPEAVEIKQDIIPNLFKIFNKNNDIIYTNDDLTSILAIGDSIECIFENINNKYILKIIDINDKFIKIDTKDIDTKINELDKIFVIGKQIQDFHMLTKDYIYSLNISATQELYKIIQKQQEYINNIEKKLETLINNFL